MTADHCADMGRRWAPGAELVCAPVAAELVSTCPHPLGGPSPVSPAEPGLRTKPDHLCPDASAFA